jgi:hypothetical protein
MNKKIQKSLSFVLAGVLLLNAIGFSALAAGGDNTQGTAKSTSLSGSARLWEGEIIAELFEKVADNLISAIAGTVPNRNWVNIKDYQSKNFYEGTKNPTTQPTAKNWLAGYASASIIPADVATGGYTTGGYFANMGKVTTGVMDDQRFSAVCLDAGNGAVIFASLDGFGLSGTDVRILRERLKSFASEHGIVSINITATHSHYCIDTLGFGTDPQKLLLANLKNVITQKSSDISSLNENFMNNLFSVAENVIKESYNSMTSGSLYYGAADISDMIADAQSPIAFDPNVNRIRFVPDNKSLSEIWLVNMNAHPTSLAMSTTEISADYPGAIVRWAKEKANANVAFYQGAEAGIYTDVRTLNLPQEDLGTKYEIDAYGKEIVRRLMSIDNETKISPILNIKHKEVFVPVTNSLLQLACKIQMVNSLCVNTTGKLKDVLAVTEIGYCELGDSLAIVLIPGEASPEIIYGGAKTAAQAWNMACWKYKPVAELAKGRKVLSFGLTNDQIGYILPDNDYAVTFAQLFSQYYGDNNEHADEMISLGSKTASTLVKAYEDLI